MWLHCTISALRGAIGTSSENLRVVAVRHEDLVVRPLEVCAELERCGMPRRADVPLHVISEFKGGDWYWSDKPRTRETLERDLNERGVWSESAVEQLAMRMRPYSGLFQYLNYAMPCQADRRVDI